MKSRYTGIVRSVARLYFVGSKMIVTCGIIFGESK